ncbi:MAG: anion permease, partial [Firmicutes bacterium]|nr:anion permease [Bacillota bacterium]
MVFDHSLFVLAILIFVVVLCVTEKLPLLITLSIAMLAMYFGGVLTFSEAFSGFESTAVIMQIGLSVLTASFFSTGLSGRIAPVLIKYSHNSEKRFILLASLVAMITAAFINATAMAMLFMSIIDTVSVNSDGKIRRKIAYMPVTIAALFGGSLTSIGLSSTIVASSILSESCFGRGFTVFETTKLTLPAVIFFFVIYITMGYKASLRIFDFEEKPIENVDTFFHPELNKPKAAILIVVLALSIYCFVASPFDLGAVTFAAAIILIVTNCIDIKSAVKSVNWEIVVILAASIGFAKGVEISGAGKLIAEFIVSVTGPLGSSPFAMCIMIMILASLLSNFMNNTSAVVILMSIAFAIANRLDTSLLPFALSCALGSNLSVS